MDVVAATRATYEQIAEDYERQSADPHPDFVSWRDAFARRADGPVADLGCGPGQHALALTLAGLEVIGMDLTTAMLTRTRAKGVPVVQGDLRRPPLCPGAFGALWSSAALLHVPRPDVPATLAAWHSLLRPGGVLALSTSLGEQDGWEQVPYATPLPTAEPLRRWFVHHDEAQLLQTLRDVGFTVEATSRRTTKRDWLMVLATA